MTKRFVSTTFFLLAFAGLCIAATTSFAMYDQGDFARMVSRVVGSPLGATNDFPAMQWEHSAGIPVPNPSSGLASLLFWLAALVQRLMFDCFSLVAWGIGIKSLMAVAMLVLARSLSDGRTGAYSGFGIALLLVAFAPHNSAFFQTFYPEQIALVALPLSCAALIGRIPGRPALFALGVMALAWTKTQYFYVPALILVILWFCKGARPMPIKRVALVCAVAQIVALLPIARSPYAEINRYNATYFGSYLELDSNERAELHLSQKQLACIGTDWWGNRIESPSDTDTELTDATCGETLKVGGKDVLAPMLRHPMVLPRMVADAVRTHWTTRYFHLDKDTRYLRVDSRRDKRATELMLFVDKPVSFLASPAMTSILLLSIPLLALRTGWRSGWMAACLFLGGFIVSQLLVSLLGEGFRDLSKHLALMLFASELLVFVILAAWLANTSTRLRKITSAS